MRCPLPLAPLLLLLLLAGCLEFDAQEITVHYDADKDRIDALVVYRGLFAEGGNGSSDKPLEKALADLDAAMQNGVFCFWSNWPLKVDPVHDRGPGTALLPHYEVETGGLFTDPRGVLCGYQFVRIRDAKAFLQKVNTMLEVAVQAAALAEHQAEGGVFKFDADSRELLRDFLRDGQQLLKVERGRVELRLPCTLRDHRFLKMQLERHLLDNLPGELVRRAAVEQHRAEGGDATKTNFGLDAAAIAGPQLTARLRGAPSFRFFWDNDFTFDRRDELTTVGIGERGADEVRIVKASGGLYHDNLLQALRARGDKIEDGVPDPELARRFAAFRGRDCALPAGYAERRAATGGR